MSQKTFPQLPTISSLALATLFAVDSGIQSFKATGQQLRDFFKPKNVGDIDNAVLQASVASSALTFALKTEAGLNPSSTDPVYVSFRNATLSSGAPVRREITAALSLVISNGSTLGHASATEAPIYVYLGDDAGTLFLAASTSPVDERILQTTTAEGGVGLADSALPLYAAAVHTNAAVRLFAVLKSTQTTAGTWAAVPTLISYPTQPHPLALAMLRPVSASAGIGGVAQSLSSGSFSTTATSLTDVTNLAVDLKTTGRPVFVGLVHDGSANYPTFGPARSAVTNAGSRQAILRNGTVISRGTIYVGGATGVIAGNVPLSAMNHIDVPPPGTHTYKLQISGISGELVGASYAMLVAFEL